MVAACLLSAVDAFVPGVMQKPSSTRITDLKPLGIGYVPDGMTAKQWADMKKKEDAKKNKRLKMDGTSGMKFRSRSFEEFQRGRESGKFGYNMPMENAQEKLRKGLIRPEDIPYMQRPGGMPDGSDLRKGFKLPWQK
jgi:hypothetical protein